MRTQFTYLSSDGDTSFCKKRIVIRLELKVLLYFQVQLNWFIGRSVSNHQQNQLEYKCLLTQESHTIKHVTEHRHVLRHKRRVIFGLGLLGCKSNTCPSVIFWTRPGFEKPSWILFCELSVRPMGLSGQLTASNTLRDAKSSYSFLGPYRAAAAQNTDPITDYDSAMDGAAFARWSHHPSTLHFLTQKKNISSHLMYWFQRWYTVCMTNVWMASKTQSSQPITWKARI